MRKKQSKICKQQKPWEHSTGPKTTKGKAATKHNAWKHGMESAESQKLVTTLREHVRYLAAIEDKIKYKRKNSV